MYGHTHSVGLSVLVGIIVAFRRYKPHRSGHAYRTRLRGLPYAYDVLHRRRGDGLFLLLGAYGYHRSVNLTAIYDGAWRVGTALRERRHGVAVAVELYVVEVHLAVGNEVDEPVAVDVAEIFRCLCFRLDNIPADHCSKRHPAYGSLRTARICGAFDGRETTYSGHLYSFAVCYRIIGGFAQLRPVIQRAAFAEHLVRQSVAVDVHECGQALAVVCGMAV